MEHDEEVAPLGAPPSPKPAPPHPSVTPRWAWAYPMVAWIVLTIHVLVGANVVVDIISAIALIATVFAAVYHAEVIAHRVGEPFGTLILAIAVTIIEVSLIVSVMITGGSSAATLARDTVFAAVMIACNGVLGLCLLAGGMRHYEQSFQVQGANAALGVLAALTVLSLVLPNLTQSLPGPVFNTPHLVFAGLVSLVLYASFVFVQTVRHRAYFLPVGDDSPGENHPTVPSTRTTAISFVLLMAALVAVVAIAKSLTPAVEVIIDHVGVPEAVVGIVISSLVLLPEGLASFRAARINRLQTSMNLVLGSALASIGLTIPAVAATSLILKTPLALGLDVKGEVLLSLTLLLLVITLGTARTTVLQGIVHLVIFIVFLFVSIVP
ncbi:MAG TPA: ionic transporter y4hA [Terriglobales bacterium]|nr:ionic transporter y4hA [Terriglobales bacterium]